MRQEKERQVSDGKRQEIVRREKQERERVNIVYFTWYFINNFIFFVLVMFLS